MSDSAVGRRGLFRGWFGAPAQAPPVRKAFSLEGFYAERRGEAPVGTFPAVRVRPDLPEVPTTDVGRCPPIETPHDEDGSS